MKRVMTLACVLSVAVVAALAAQAAQTPMTPMTKMAITSEADYSTAMKEVGSQSAALRKALASKNEEDAMKAATRLELVFKDVHAYWVDKKVTDATTAAQDAMAAAQAVTKALAAHDIDMAGQAATKMGASCMACHTAHRERLPDGSYKMK